jgi:hypothetical protein
LRFKKFLHFLYAEFGVDVQRAIPIIRLDLKDHHPFQLEVIILGPKELALMASR